MFFFYLLLFFLRCCCFLALFHSWASMGLGAGGGWAWRCEKGSCKIKHNTFATKREAENKTS